MCVSLDGANGYDGWLDSEEDIEWASDDPQDAPGGAGCNFIQFTGQGANGLEKTYYGILNGTSWTQLSLTDPTVKFNCIYTATCRNTEGIAGNASRSPLASGACANIGTITIRSVTTGKTLAIINPNQGRTQMMIWRCPSDHWGQFKKVSIYPSAGKPLVARLMGRIGVEASWVCLGAIDFDGNIASITHPMPDYIPPGTDICLTVTPEGIGTNCSAQFWVEKIKDPDYGRV